VSTTRRVYFYAVCLVTLVLAAWGMGLLLSLIFDSLLGTHPAIARTRSYPSQQLALGLSMLVIAGVVWTIHWRIVQKLSAANPKEGGAAIRKLYLNSILTASALTALITGTAIMRWILGGAPSGESRSGALAALLVSLAVWYYNWRVDTADAPPNPGGKTLQRWCWYVLAGWSMVVMSLGAINILALLLDRGISSGDSFAQGQLWNSHMQLRVAGIMLGLPWWAFHWLHAARNDQGSSLRQVYLYLFAITAGALTTLVSLSVTVFRVLQLLFGSALNWQTGVNSFVWTLPAGLLGVAVWTYHWQIARDESGNIEERQSSARRVYHYIMSGLGLAGIASGGVSLIGLTINIVLGAIDPSSVMVSTPGWWKDQLALFLVLLGIGLAVWLHFWPKVQGQVIRSSVERAARSRKVYLYTFLCISIIAVVAGLIDIVYQTLNALLQSNTVFDTLDRMKWGIQAFLVAAPSVMYHFALLRDDIRGGSERAKESRTISIIVPREAAQKIVTRLELALGQHLRTISFEGETAAPWGELSEEQTQTIIRSIAASPHPRLLVIYQDAEWKVLPYEERS